MSASSPATPTGLPTGLAPGVPTAPGDVKEPPALAHIEKTLTDSYRKEIDQEENIWRSLPFFAATLALQLAALFQVVERLPTGTSWATMLPRGLLASSVISSLGALGCLAWSIFPAKFRYVAKDAALLEYAFGLMEDENNPANLVDPAPMVALHTLKRSLATQYALATDHNRRINKARELRRSIAGMLTLCSVVFTLVLVGTTFTSYVPKQIETGVVHDPQPQPGVQPGVHPGTQPAPGPASPKPLPPGAADAGGD